MVMRPRHALAAAAILTAVTLGSWAALSTDNHTPTPQAAAQQAAPVTCNTRRTDRQQTRRVGRHHAQQARRLQAPVLCPTTRPPCRAEPAGSRAFAGDFDGDQARDQLLAYAELDAVGQPSQWHVRAVLATGHISDLALANSRGLDRPQRAGRPPGRRRQRRRPRRGVRHLHRGRLQRRLQPLRTGRLPAPPGPGCWCRGATDPGRRVSRPCRRLRLPGHRPARPAPPGPGGHRAGLRAT